MHTGVLAASSSLALALLVPPPAAAQARPRARDLGIPFDGTPGLVNAITDVSGVEVGFTTLVAGSGPVRVGQGPVRTGVTGVLPRGRASSEPVLAGWFSMNGNGEMTGTAWVEESGFLEGPVMITNTHSVGVVRDGVIAWQVGRHFVPRTSGDEDGWWSMPVVAETWDGWLNDINGFHVRPEHVSAALDGARPGPVAEGNVGGGTGMICYEFKGGTGTASRVARTPAGEYTVGVLVQCNCGGRSELTIAGVPVGKEIPESRAYASAARPDGSVERGSIIIVVATDAPLLPKQLERLARRAALGLARTGSKSGNYSGDLFVAFSTANAGAAEAPLATLRVLSNNVIDPVFLATVQATEEAIVNAMVAAETTVGANDHRAIALPHDRLREVMHRYGR